MVSIFIIILVISQLLCFYFILLLNMKVAKFKDLEKRQDQVLKEMDDSIGLYLIEMKEENDRLIKELWSVNNIHNNTKHVVQGDNSSIVEKDNKTTKKNGQDSQEEVIKDSKPFVPKSIVKNAYNQQKINSTQSSDKSEEKDEKEKSSLPSFEQKVLTLYKNGTSIDKIAKITQKGKTEIELLVKFHA